MRPHRHALLASTVSLAALTGILFVPATASAQPAGTPATPAITLTLNPATVDYGDQSVTTSGTVTTTTGPVVGATVTVSYENVAGQSAQILLTTNSAGGYSGTISDPAPAVQEVTASVAATSGTAAASASAQLGFTKDAVTITASFAQPYVNAGSTDTLSGVASYVSGDTPHPLANSHLSITFTESGAFNYSFSATVETAADGSFSYVTPEIYLAIQSGFASISSAATRYLDAGQVSASFMVNEEAQISSFSGHLTPYRMLRFAACGGIPEPLADVPLVGPLEYQYSSRRTGPWKTLGTGTSVRNGRCFAAEFGGTYAGSFKAPLASAYYRAYAPAVPGQMAAVSQVIHLAKNATRFTGFSVTPRSVRRGRKVTVSGRLWVMQRKWKPDARQKLTIEYRFRGKIYVLSSRLRTNAAGRFTGTFRVRRTAFWIASYSGSRSEFACRTRAIRVGVR